MTYEQKLEIKSKNEEKIKNKGFNINKWLPILDTGKIRTIQEIKGRMSVMNALVNIAFEAPTYIIKEWIEEQKLTSYLSNEEAKILDKDNSDLSNQEINSLHWYLEGLWTFLWITNLIDTLDEEKHVGDNMSSFLPNLEQGENNKRIENLNSIRSEEEIYTMLDHYYRIHWYCVNERLNGRLVKLNEGQIYERRKVLEWVMNREDDWDSIEMGT